MATRPAPEELGQRLQELLESLEEIADPTAQARVEEVLSTVLEMYGVGIERILEICDAAGLAGARVKQQMVDDGVVASLLLIHGLYPVGLEERVLEALAEVRPFMENHGGDVELLGVADGVARLRLTGSCDGCPASQLTLENAIREAIDAAAPDLVGLEVEGVVPPPVPGTPTTPSAPKIELPMVQVGAPPAGGYTECPSGLRA
jgi:Fe-S cluster biogenesis protein NfuA